MKSFSQFATAIKRGYMISLSKNIKLTKDNLRKKAMQRAIEQDISKGIFANYYKIIDKKIYRKVNNRLEPTGVGYM